MGGAAREHVWVKIDRNFWKSRATAISASRIRQPLRPHRRGPASGAGARSPSLSRCFVFVWPSSHVVYFFWPNLLLPAWPIMCVISSFFTAQIFGILEIGNMWGPQVSSSPNHRQGRRWIFEICAFFPSPSSGLFVFPLISSGLFVSLFPSRVRVFWIFFRVRLHDHIFLYNGFLLYTKDNLSYRLGSVT